jgi:hypothetical protein
VLSFGDISLHKQRKVTRSPVGRVEALHLNGQAVRKELDSSLRWNDELKKGWIPACAGMSARKRAAR